MLFGIRLLPKKASVPERDIAECYEELKDYESAISYWQKYKDMQEEGSDEAIEAEDWKALRTF